jgi:hypothetical protein
LPMINKVKCFLLLIFFFLNMSMNFIP